MDTNHLLQTALTWQKHGYTPVPTKTDGTKHPRVPWAKYNEHPATPQNVTQDFNCDTDGIGLVCGAASAELEMLEVEGRAINLVADLAQLLVDNGFSALWARINNGYVEASPSGGIHWHYRISDGTAKPNTKLASRLATPEELATNPTEKRKVLIETRGTGGFTIIAPSAGRTHPTGKAWTVLLGSITTIPTLTTAERDALYAIAGILDQLPTIDAPTRQPNTNTPTDSTRPGDDYNTRAQWADILDGWTRTKQFTPTCYGWTRPGKSARDGISATTGRNPADNLYVFSSSTEFETETPYSKFGAYTLLKFDGDYKAAAKHLATQGYGTQPGHTVTPSTPNNPFGVAGNLATITQLPQPSERPITIITERTLTHSDDANALALVDRFGDRIRYCSDRGRWYAWTGTVWEQCARTSGLAREYAKRIARSLPETDTPSTAHKKRSLSAIGITAMLTQAATDQTITVTYDQLDAHPWELNTPGGIIDLHTGALLPSDPTKLHTRITSCTPDPAADTTTWHTFLGDTFTDMSVVTYLQRLVGYSATGVIGAHVLPFCYGSGGNGKGVFLEACSKTLGGYATTAPAGFLMAKTHVSHETEIARLSGARMVLCSEINEEDHFDESRVKQLTGGDTLTARFMAQDHFTFTPTHHLWLMGNHQPTVKSGGHSFWRRLRLIEFNREVPDNKIIDDLQGILATQHGPAILNWIIQGATNYNNNGLQEPAAVMAATAGYAHDQDTVTRFLEEACRLGGGDQVQVKVAIIRTAYERWCLEVGETPVIPKAFGLALGRAGVTSTRTKAARFYQGITLLADDDASPEPNDEPDDGWYR